jgi:hypothetical protein
MYYSWRLLLKTTTMTAEEKSIINTLLENLRHIEGESPKRDKDVVKLIKEGTNGVPGFEYSLFQAVVAQQDLVRRLKDLLEKNGVDSSKVDFVTTPTNSEESGESAGFLSTAGDTAATLNSNSTLINALANVADNVDEVDASFADISDDLDVSTPDIPLEIEDMGLDDMIDNDSFDDISNIYTDDDSEY